MLAPGSRDDHEGDARGTAEDAHEDESFEVAHVARHSLAGDASAEHL